MLPPNSKEPQWFLQSHPSFKRDSWHFYGRSIWTADEVADTFQWYPISSNCHLSLSIVLRYPRFLSGKWYNDETITFEDFKWRVNVYCHDKALEICFSVSVLKQRWECGSSWPVDPQTLAEDWILQRRVAQSPVMIGECWQCKMDAIFERSNSPIFVDSTAQIFVKDVRWGQ